MNSTRISRYFYDANHVRYELYRTNGGAHYSGNIRLFFVGKAGHFVWVENPEIVRKLFDEFSSQLDVMLKAL